MEDWGDVRYFQAGRPRCFVATGFRKSICLVEWSLSPFLQERRLLRPPDQLRAKGHDAVDRPPPDQLLDLLQGMDLSASPEMTPATDPTTKPMIQCTRCFWLRWCRLACSPAGGAVAGELQVPMLERRGTAE